VDLFSSRVKSLFIQVVDLSRFDDVPSRSRVRLQWTGDSQVYSCRGEAINFTLRYVMMCQ